jgi:histidine triad (HIT) family protein
MAYDENNVFAKVLRGEIPCHKIYEDEDTLAFLDIMPRTMGAEGVLIQQFNGAAAGQTVFHLHVHIVPRKEGETLKPHAGKMEDQAKLTATAEKIRKALGV